MTNIKDPQILFERSIDEYAESVPGEVMPPWNQWLLYVESAKARREMPMSYSMWAQANGWSVEIEEDDVIFI